MCASHVFTKTSPTLLLAPCVRLFSALLFVICLSTNSSSADESGVSFWYPGTFGSVAAVPVQPGWSFTAYDYYGSVIGNKTDFVWLQPGYTFATPVLGGQAAVGLGTFIGGDSTSSDSVTGFGDLYPQATLKWNQGVNNFIGYVTGGIPVGAYDAKRLSNLGLGHGAVDGGFGYTYFDQKSGHEFSAVTGLTDNFTNPSTHYRSGVDWHFDWAASQFLSQQFSVGAVGYVYKQIGCDSGSGDLVGCFQSQVFGIGPQLTFLLPIGAWQGCLNLKTYKEFDAENRPDGWNAWITFSISPAAPSAKPLT